LGRHCITRSSSCRRALFWFAGRRDHAVEKIDFRLNVRDLLADLLIMQLADEFGQ
jgi:hypothetical protein